VIDERLIHGLHVELLRKADLAEERAPHVVFQTATVAALLDGSFEGDVSFAELAQHGDLGLGTLDGLDGEMIAVDGRFLRADVEGSVTEIDAATRTPFAVMTWFSPVVSFALDEPLDHDDFVREMNRHAPPGSPSCAVRIDGAFELVHARSVPRQSKPYPSLAEAAAAQHEFELREVTGTMVGFRFPDYAQGLEVAGYHLHFVDADRRRGGHVLSCRPRAVTVQIDHASDLHMELPPDVQMPAPASEAERDAVRRVESDR
jgi:acetolactate decarboxylase